MSLVSILTFASAFTSTALAIAGLIRTRRTMAVWTFTAGMGLIALERLCTGFGLTAQTVGTLELWQRSQLIVLSLIPGAWLLFSLTFARGNASDFLTRWRTIWTCAMALPAGVAIGFSGHLLAPTQARAADGPHLQLGLAGVALYMFLLVCSVFILMNFERTFRASVGTMRWRIKFVLLGVGLLFVVRIYTASQALLFRGLDVGLEFVNSIALLVGAVVLMQGLIRNRQVESDVYPSLSVLQGSLTITIAGVYLLVVGVFAKITTYVGGDSAFTIKAFFVLVSLVGLALLLQSDRVQLNIRRFLSRNFQRPVYDYRAIWRKFTEGTASCVEQTDLCRSIVRITADIFQALAVSIWLVNDRRDSLALAASTSLSETKARERAPSAADTLEVLRYFEAHPEPVDIETPKDGWAETLRRLHPSEFTTGGNRVCVPMLRHNELVGIMVMGDRVKGVSFPLQDFDLLKCIADQAAAELLNIQLGQRLVQTKELEAFQTMATFFVHDLKNAASTLNLMLRNMPVHFNDPAFREDALRGMAKTVAHMNSIVGRLGELRNRLDLRLVPTDLNEIVRSTLASFPASDGLVIQPNLRALPLVSLDTEQFRKVVLNLLLNASEACQGRGEVHVETEQRGASAVLTVSDNGCGMSPEFLQGALFRPFRTTKKSGLGIGMFQSKMIVDAHGGSIVVTSASGQGARFDIHLPIRGNQP